MKKILDFLKDVKSELKKVKWATKKELVSYSIATITFVIIFAIFFMLSDVLIASLKALVH